MSGPTSLLTIQLLSWLAARPRSYAELKDAWRSTCPLTCAWEDALNDGLVALAAGRRMDETSVVLTPRGQEALSAASDERRGSPLSPFPLDPTAPRL
jgi:hypothetical protein